MSPPSLGSGDDKAGCGWKEDFKKILPAHLIKTDLQNTCNDSLINALQGLQLDGTLKVPTLDISASNSVLDLSDGVGEGEWLLSASLAGSVDGAALLDVDGREWFASHPSQEICDTDKKKLLVDMLDGLAEHSLGDGSVFTAPQCNLSKNTSIQRMISHENSPKKKQKIEVKSSKLVEEGIFSPRPTRRSAVQEPCSQVSKSIDAKKLKSSEPKFTKSLKQKQSFKSSPKSMSKSKKSSPKSRSKCIEPRISELHSLKRTLRRQFQEAPTSKRRPQG